MLLRWIKTQQGIIIMIKSLCNNIIKQYNKQYKAKAFLFMFSQVESWSENKHFERYLSSLRLLTDPTEEGLFQNLEAAAEISPESQIKFFEPLSAIDLHLSEQYIDDNTVGSQRNKKVRYYCMNQFKKEIY